MCEPPAQKRRPAPGLCSHRAWVLAMLVGVNVGPNLTYAGSLATLLWRGVLSAQGSDTELGEFTRLGLLTVPAALVLCTMAACRVCTRGVKRGRRALQAEGWAHNGTPGPVMRPGYEA